VPRSVRVDPLPQSVTGPVRERRSSPTMRRTSTFSLIGSASTPPPARTFASRYGLLDQKNRPDNADTRVGRACQDPAALSTRAHLVARTPVSNPYSPRCRQHQSNNLSLDPPRCGPPRGHEQHTDRAAAKRCLHSVTSPRCRTALRAIKKRIAYGMPNRYSSDTTESSLLPRPATTPGL